MFVYWIDPEDSIILFGQRFLKVILSFPRHPLIMVFTRDTFSTDQRNFSSLWLNVKSSFQSAHLPFYVVFLTIGGPTSLCASNSFVTSPVSTLLDDI